MTGSAGQVFVFSRAKNLPALVTEVIPGGLRVNHVNDPLRWPVQRTQFYLTAGSLSYRTEGAAAKMGAALPVCLPAAHRWLTGQIAALAREGDVYLFHACLNGELINKEGVLA